MILNITTDYRVVSDLETAIISADMLNFSTTHMFIASNVWESCIVEISDKIPAGSLKFLPGVCTDIKVKLPENVTEHQMRLLADLFPNLSGTIRKNFMLGKHLGGVVPTC